MILVCGKLAGLGYIPYSSPQLIKSERKAPFQDISEFIEPTGAAAYALISEGMGLGTLASGVYAALSAYVVESERTRWTSCVP